MKLIIMRVDKEMSTEECLKHAKLIRQATGLKVLIIDKKVVEVTTLDLDDELVLGDYIVIDGIDEKIIYKGDDK